MMTTRQSALFAIFLGGLVLAALSGCSAGNPHMSAAESAVEQENYERALANVDTAITQDSANVEAYMMKARILRQMADNSTPPDEYKRLYEEARNAEDQAIKFDPARRSDVDAQRRLAYIQEYRKGAKQFRGAQNQEDYLRAAAFFGAAGAIRPDSAGPILNEAFARINAAQATGGQDASQMMSEVIPILERYLEKADQPSMDAYNILAQLYMQDNQPQRVIELTSRAIEDLSNRPTHFRISGTNGVNYTGTVEEGGASRNVEGTIPDRIRVSRSEGTVSGSFQKQQKKGSLRVSFYLQGSRLATDQLNAPTDTATISVDLAGQTPLAQLQGYRLNALNQTGDREQAKELYRQQIEQNPNNATYRYNYGSLLLEEDRFEEAAKHLQKAVDLDPDDPKKQFNLGASYLNHGAQIQDSLVALRDTVLADNRKPTKEEKVQLQELDQKRRELFRQAVQPLERARQLSGAGGEYRSRACSALLQAYVQLEQTEKAEEVESCATQSMPGEGQGNGSSGGLGY